MLLNTSPVHHFHGDLMPMSLAVIFKFGHCGLWCKGLAMQETIIMSVYAHLCAHMRVCVCVYGVCIHLCSSVAVCASICTSNPSPDVTNHE